MAHPSQLSGFAFRGRHTSCVFSGVLRSALFCPEFSNGTRRHGGRSTAKISGESRRNCLRPHGLPGSNRYAPAIQRISAKYEGRAAFWLAYPDSSESAEKIRQHEREYNYKLPALRDPQRVLVKLAQVRVTPEVAVFDTSRHLAYHGRIDDWYQDLGRARRWTSNDTSTSDARADSGNQYCELPPLRAVASRPSKPRPRNIPPSCRVYRESVSDFM